MMDELITCEECEYFAPEIYWTSAGKFNFSSCKNEDSPCYRKSRKETDFCEKAKRKDSMISRQAALDILGEYEKQVLEVQGGAYERARKAILRLPQKPKRGKWMDDGKEKNDGFCATCSACGAWSEYLTDYCGNCGAYMRSEEDG